MIITFNVAASTHMFPRRPWRFDDDVRTVCRSCGSFTIGDRAFGDRELSRLMFFRYDIIERSEIRNTGYIVNTGYFVHNAIYRMCKKILNISI